MSGRGALQAPGTRPGAAPGRAEHGFRADIQGLRGIAVLLVVMYHAGWWFPGGFVGVDVFFVISGFVVTRSVVAERARTGRVSVLGFYGRRIRRLVPALAVMLGVTSLASLLLLSPLDQIGAAADTARAAAVSVANLQLYGDVDYFGPAAETNPFTHTWSLSVEEQFYVLFPLLAVVTLGRSGRRRAMVAALALVGVASLALNLWWASGRDLFGADDPARLAFYSPASRAWEFAAGALLGLVVNRAVAPSPRNTRLAAIVLGAAGLVGLAWAVATLSTTDPFPGWRAIVPVTATGALIIGGAVHGPLRAILETRALVFVGDVSYGFYLWHWPCIVLAHRIGSGWAPPAVAVSLGLAALSYRWLERPLRLRFPGRRAFALGLACAVTAAAIGVGVGRAGDTNLGIDGLADLRVVPEARVRGCHGDLDEPVVVGGRCAWTVPDPQGVILLVGDSHAVSIADAVVAVGNRQGYDVYVTTRSLCPFSTLRVKRRGCAGYQRAMLETIEQLRPAVVVIANRAPLYTLPAVGGGGRPIVDTDDDETTTAPDALAMWSLGLRRAVDRIEAIGGRVVIVDSVPEFPSDGPRSVSVLRPGGDPAVLGLGEVEARRGPTSAVHHDLARQRESAVIVDPVPVLCDAVCSQRRGGVWLFRDDDHVSAAGAALIGSLIATAIDEALRAG